MALVTMTCFDTEKNKRSKFTQRTLESLERTVDWHRHRLVVVDNRSCAETKEILNRFVGGSEATRKLRATFVGADPYNTCQVITLPENIGTARGLNKAWQLRRPGECVLKVDNDVEIHEQGWLDRLEECIARDPKIGIIGLKRKDLDENPWSPPGNWEHSDLHMLPHQKGQTWLVVEKVQHVMGTCCLFNSALLDKVGYLVQPGVYGLDDSLMAFRCKAAGFYSCFYPHYHIDHIDPGGDAYTEEKRKYAGERMAIYDRVRREITQGIRSYYFGSDEDLT